MNKHRISRNPEASHDRSKALRLLAVITAAALMIMCFAGCGAGNVAPTESTLKMPDLVGKTQDDAVKEIEKIGLAAVVTEVETDEEAEGKVFSHVPTAGKSVKSGDNVTLYVAKSKPTEKPVEKPTMRPTEAVTQIVTEKPTDKPSDKPTEAPDDKPEPVPDGGTAYLYCTADDYVTLRASADVKSKELARITYGESMLYMNAKQNKWYYVKYGSELGYVYEDYVSFSDPKEAKKGATLYCTSEDYVRLREGPFVSSAEIAKIPQGDTMEYLGIHSGRWYYVQYNSQKGYVYDGLVSSDRSDIDR